MKRIITYTQADMDALVRRGVTVTEDVAEKLKSDGIELTGFDDKRLTRETIVAGTLTVTFSDEGKAT